MPVRVRMRLRLGQRDNRKTAPGYFPTLAGTVAGSDYSGLACSCAMLAH